MSLFRTAVVPAAGLGTRFLPATKTMPKELVPIVDTPVVQLIAEEAAAAGADRLLLVVSPEKQDIAAHFAPAPELEATLTARGKNTLAARVASTSRILEVCAVTQPQPLGLGHAVLQAEPALPEDEDAIAVLLPDDLVLPHGALDAMAQVRSERGGSVLCAIDVPREEVSAYGVFDVESIPGEPDVLKVNGMVEKPAVDAAPSTFAATGRYLLDRAIFDALSRIAPGAGGELQLTDAIALLIAEGHPVHVVVHRGVRHDVGTPPGYLRAVVDMALRRADTGPALRQWLVRRLIEDETRPEAGPAARSLSSEWTSTTGPQTDSTASPPQQQRGAVHSGPHRFHGERIRL